MNAVESPKPYAIGFLLSSVVAVLIVIAMIVLGEYTKTRGRFLLTALVFEAYFFFGLASAWAAEKRLESIVARTALVAAIAALLMLLIGIWGTPDSDAFWKSTAIIATLAVVLAYAAVVDVMPGRLASSFQVKPISLASVIACVGIAAGINWPPYWWVFTLVVLVWVGALVVPAASYLGRRLAARVQRR
jgi:hypothetical protein